MLWESVFKKEEIALYKDKIFEIAEIIKKNKNNESGLVSGRTGLALFLKYYSKYQNDTKAYDIAENLICSEFETINNGFNNIRFANGISGILWGASHLVNEGLCNFEIDDSIKEIEELISEKTNDIVNKERNFDYFHGALGHILHLILNNSSNKVKKNINKSVIALLEIADFDKNIYKWKSEINNSGIFGYNLGLAHGQPSIYSILSHVYKNNISKEIVFKLIEGNIKYIISNKSKYSNGAIFPNWDNKDNENHGSRLAWCYGDLGIGITLYVTGRRMKVKAWEEEGNFILLNSAKRLIMEDNHVKDACFCHGTSGNAHIFNRMYNYTGIETYKEVARYWFEKTLAMGKIPEGSAGYLFYAPKENGGWGKSNALLGGIAGVGLILISAVAPIEPKWDECFLLS